MSAGGGLQQLRETTLRDATPLSVHLELTYRCAWRCRFCYNARHRDLTPLSVSEWQRVLQELKRLGSLFVTLTGGDPLAHPGFFDVAEEARRQALVLRVFTNGSRVDAAVAARLAELRPLGVELSLHGATPAVHESVTGVPGSFDQLWAAVGHLRGRGVRIVLKMPVTCLNESELDAAVALAEAHGVALRVDVALSPRDDGDVTPLRYQASESGVSRLMARLAAQGRVPSVDERRAGGVNCGLGRTTLAIDPEGNVYPCLQWRSSTLGNVRQLALDEIWCLSPVRQRAAEIAVAANDRLRELGGAAERYPFCPGLALQRTGDALTPPPEFHAHANAALAARTRGPGSLQAAKQARRADRGGR